MLSSDSSPDVHRLGLAVLEMALPNPLHLPLDSRPLHVVWCPLGSHPTHPHLGIFVAGALSWEARGRVACHQVGAVEGRRG